MSLSADAQPFAHSQSGEKIYKVQKYARQMNCAPSLNLTEIQQFALLFLSVCNNLLNHSHRTVNAMSKHCKSSSKEKLKKKKKKKKKRFP